VLTAEEVLTQLEDRENSTVHMEAESNARLGTVYSRHLEENESQRDERRPDRAGDERVNIYGLNEYLHYRSLWFHPLLTVSYFSDRQFPMGINMERSSGKIPTRLSLQMLLRAGLQ
jgi:hypothetical protein